MEMTEFLAEIPAIEKFCRETLGYTTAEVLSVNLRENGSGEVVINLTDDFQDNLSADIHYYHERYRYVSFDSPEAVGIGLFLSYPNRAQRELRVMARQMASVKGMGEHLASVEAQHFVTTILRNADKLFEAIEDKRILEIAETEEVNF